MAEEFIPINTQEDFDKAVQEKYGNVSELQNQITKLTGERDTHANTIADLQKQVNDYKLGELRAKIAKENGIPLEMAARLSGADEKALREDAKALAANLKSFMGADPNHNPSNNKSSGSDADLADMLRAMKGE